MDFRNIDVSTVTNNIDKSWRGYPQNLFGNWTPDQVERSEMLIKCLKNQSSTIYWMDVGTDGKFATPDMRREGRTSTVTATAQDVCEDGHISTVTTTNQDEFWDIMQRQVNLIYLLCAGLLRDFCSDQEISECDRYLWMT